jgi:phospholipid/cholesterol/gamma-HCH transport system substrate-binding protein
MRVQHRKRLPAWVIGLVMVVVIAVGSVLAYTKELPWTDRYEVTATFASGIKLRTSNPVRIAGVNVGEVTDVELLSDEESTQAVSTTAEGLTSAPSTGVKVTMALNEEALPLHEDALFKIRPRLFLEGNYFVELQPGSPSSPVVEEGHEYPINRTAYAVQLDQVLTTLQYDVRENLQSLLQDFGAALSVHGGADGLRALNRTGPLLQYSSQAAEAFRGEQEGDLRGMISGLAKVLGGLSKSESDLRELITNFRVFTGSFAAQSDALGRAIDQLPDTLAAAQPAFDNLNASFPLVRAFAREALPGVRTSPESLRASRPFIEQLRLLMRPTELQGLVADLRPTVPKLYKLGQRNIGLFRENRALSSCFNEVIVPWSKDQVSSANPNYPFEPGEPAGPSEDTKVFEEGPYGFTGTAVESRSGDANGQNLRVLGGSGANLVRSNIAGLGDVVALTPYPILGATPALGDSAKTPFKPNVNCETQEPPSLEAGLAPPPPDQEPVAASAQGIDALSGPGANKFRKNVELVNGLGSLPDLLDSSDETVVKDALRDLEDAQSFMNEIGLGDADLARALGVEVK